MLFSLWIFNDTIKSLRFAIFIEHIKIVLFGFPQSPKVTSYSWTSRKYTQCSVDSATWCLYYNQVKTMKACCLPGFADCGYLSWLEPIEFWSSMSEIWVYKTTALVFKIFTTSSGYLPETSYYRYQWLHYYLLLSMYYQYYHHQFPPLWHVAKAMDTRDKASMAFHAAWNPIKNLSVVTEKTVKKVVNRSNVSSWLLDGNQPFHSQPTQWSYWPGSW